MPEHMVTAPSPLDLLIEKIRLLRHEEGVTPPSIRESGLTPHAPAVSANVDAALSREMPSSRFPHASATPGVSSRVAAFRQQLAEWTASGRLGVPLLALPRVPVQAAVSPVARLSTDPGGAWRVYAPSKLCLGCLRSTSPLRAHPKMVTSNIWTTKGYALWISPDWHSRPHRKASWRVFEESICARMMPPPI
jgi:hypothetical protein